MLGSSDGHAVPVCSQAIENPPDAVAAIVLHVVQEFFDKAQGGMTRLEGTHELFAVSVEWERQKVSIAPESHYVYSHEMFNFCGRSYLKKIVRKRSHAIFIRADSTSWTDK